MGAMAHAAGYIEKPLLIALPDRLTDRLDPILVIGEGLIHQAVVVLDEIHSALGAVIGLIGQRHGGQTHGLQRGAP